MRTAPTLKPLIVCHFNFIASKYLTSHSHLVIKNYKIECVTNVILGIFSFGNLHHHTEDNFNLPTEHSVAFGNTQTKSVNQLLYPVHFTLIWIRISFTYTSNHLFTIYINRICSHMLLFLIFKTRQKSKRNKFYHLRQHWKHNKIRFKQMTTGKFECVWFRAVFRCDLWFPRITSMLFTHECEQYDVLMRT